MLIFEVLENIEILGVGPVSLNIFISESTKTSWLELCVVRAVRVKEG